jgi:hypothetical protein
MAASCCSTELSGADDAREADVRFAGDLVFVLFDAGAAFFAEAAMLFRAAVERTTFFEGDFAGVFAGDFAGVFADDVREARDLDAGDDGFVFASFCTLVGSRFTVRGSLSSRVPT